MVDGRDLLRELMRISFGVPALAGPHQQSTTNYQLCVTADNGLVTPLRAGIKQDYGSWFTSSLIPGLLPKEKEARSTALLRITRVGIRTNHSRTIGEQATHPLSWGERERVRASVDHLMNADSRRSTALTCNLQLSTCNCRSCSANRVGKLRRGVPARRASEGRNKPGTAVRHEFRELARS